MDPFWRSSAGKWTLAGVGAAVAVGLAAAFSKSSAAPTTATGAGGYYIFSVTTPYASAGGGTAGNLATVTQALQAAGFSNLQIEADPNNGSGWVASGLWTGSGTPTLPASAGSITAASASGTTPPGPYTTQVLNSGDWYTFTIETIYDTAGANPPVGPAQSLQNTSDLLAGMGFSVAPSLITPQASNPNRWNVAAQWSGTGSATDAPPLFLFVPPPGTSTSPEPVDAGTTTPSTPSA